MMPIQSSARMTPEQVLDAIHDLAQNGDGAGRRWALTQLNQTDSGIALDRPKTEDEVDERVARQLRGVGLERAQMAFRRAYPQAIPLQWIEARKRGTTYVPVTVSELKELFPEVPLDAYGDPVGFPKDKNVLARKRWIADQAVQMNDARKARERGEMAVETK